jgi:hypothetical protein
MEPLNHLDKYKNIFEDFNFLRDNLIDFSKLEIL